MERICLIFIFGCMECRAAQACPCDRCGYTLPSLCEKALSGARTGEKHSEESRRLREDTGRCQGERAEIIQLSVMAGIPGSNEGIMESL
jgi:hypothetical protein